MKRRRFLQALALAPLAPKLAALPPPVAAVPVPPPRVNFSSLTPAQRLVWSRDVWTAYRVNLPVVPKAARKARRL